jgi:hypothetical protein
LVLNNKSYKNAWYILQTSKADVYGKSKNSKVLTISGKQFYHTTDSFGSYICEIIVAHAYVAYCTEPCPFYV